MSSANDLNQLTAQAQNFKKATKFHIWKNTTFWMETEKMKANDRERIYEILVFDGFLDAKRVRILKDDGCSTNVNSLEIFKKNKEILTWVSCKFGVGHSKSRSSEKSYIVVLGAVSKLEMHKYRSNWLFDNYRYDLLWECCGNFMIIRLLATKSD